MVSHCSSEGWRTIAQIVALWSATSIAAQTQPMEASGLEICIAVGMSCNAEVDGWRFIFGPLKLGPGKVSSLYYSSKYGLQYAKW